MSVFKCEKCSCVENTAVSNYWTREKGSPALCSECDPKIGKWHGRFPKQSSDGLVEKNGFLISPEEDAQLKALELAMQTLPNVKHPGPEGIAKFFFGYGWNRGVEFGRKNERRGDSEEETPGDDCPPVSLRWTSRGDRWRGILAG